MKRICGISLLGFCCVLFVRSQSLNPSQPAPGKPVVVPTLYDEDRFVATPITDEGKKALEDHWKKLDDLRKSAKNMKPGKAG